MIVIKSPSIEKKAQEIAPPRPWELTKEEQEYLDPIPQQPAPWEFTGDEQAEMEPIGEGMLGQPATEEDFRAPQGPVVPPEPEETKFEIKPLTDYTFLPFAPTPDDAIPVDPQQFIGEEVEIPMTPIEDANAKLNIREKIFYSLNNGTPLRISYTTLDGESFTERTVHPDYVYWAGTNRHILVAWDRMKNDWRAFAVDNISLADLLDADEVVRETPEEDREEGTEAA